MIPAAFCALALAGLNTRVLDRPPDNQDPTARGTHEQSLSQPHRPSSGLTLELLNGLPPYRNAGVAPVYPVYQPYIYRPYLSGGVYPYYSTVRPFNSYAYPFGLGGYSPPRAGGRYGFGWYW